MDVLKYVEKIRRIDQLIRMKATGTPKELAKKMDVSESTLYEYLKLMKDINAPIIFDNILKTYIYSEKVNFRFSFEHQEISENNLHTSD